MKFEYEQQLCIPTLIGENIVLRPCGKNDFEAIRAYRQDIENCRFIRPPEDDERTHEIVDQHCEPWKLVEGRWNGLIICLKGTCEAVGEISFKIEDWAQQRAELGYRLSGQCAGKGVCTEASRLLIDYLFNTIEVHKVVAKCDPRNIASFKVMEKLGMKREGYFKQHFLIGDEWSDQLDYGLLRSEWIDLQD